MPRDFDDLIMFLFFLFIVSVCMGILEKSETRFQFLDIYELIRVKSPLDVNTNQNIKYLSENVVKVCPQMIRF